MWDLCDLQAAGHVWGRKTERKDAQPKEPHSLQLSKGLTNGRQDKNTSFLKFSCWCCCSSLDSIFSQATQQEADKHP